MARIVVVSESSALSLALATTDHDIVEMQPADVQPYEADLFVVDLEQPVDAVSLLGELAAEPAQPAMLVVIGDSPEWHSVHALDLDGLAVVERPVSRASLLGTVDHLLAGRPLEGSTPAWPLVPAQPSPVTDPGDLPIEPLLSAPDLAAATAAQVLPETSRPHKAPKPPRPVRVRGRRRAAHVVTAPEQPKAEHTDTLADAARDIRHSARRLQGLDIVACDAVGRAMAAVDGTAGALLLRDEGVWRTAGGLALRPREWTAELAPDAWVVDLVARQHRGLIVEDTDIARQRLVNVPLARCRHLLAVPVPDVHGVMLVGRDDEAFSPEDLQAVAEAGQDASDDLAEAVLLRDVADSLHRFAERRTP